MAVDKIKALIVDDSAVVRQVLTALLERDPRITVIGAAPDPIFAMQRMNERWPDVVVLDVEMPRMDGITFLRKIMAIRPTPVVLCSSLTAAGTGTAIQGIEAGAVSFVTKPTTGVKQFLESDTGGIVAAVLEAACADMRKVTSPATARVPVSAGAGGTASARPAAPPAPNRQPPGEATDRLVAIGTSTGGTQALEAVLTRLHRSAPGIVVVQHMPEKFTAAFAQRLNHLCTVAVIEAQDGDWVQPGQALIAPGGQHTSIERQGGRYRLLVRPGPPVNRHCPSVDVLFRSVAKHAGPNALGVIMTGMGDDGARGLREMRDAGARTLGQDESTCVVYGMPKVAHEMGGVERELPLTAIAGVIQQFGAFG